MFYNGIGGGTADVKLHIVELHVVWRNFFIFHAGVVSHALFLCLLIATGTCLGSESILRVKSKQSCPAYVRVLSVFCRGNLTGIVSTMSSYSTYWTVFFSSCTNAIKQQLLWAVHGLHMHQHFNSPCVTFDGGCTSVHIPRLRACRSGHM